MKRFKRYEEFKIDINESDFNIIAYTARALKSVGLRNLIPKMYEEASAGGHYHTMTVCECYIEQANEVLEDEVMCE